MSDTQPSAVPLLTDLLHRWAEERGHDRAFTFADFAASSVAPGPTGVHRTLTWRALDERARSVARALAPLASPGDRAALVMPQGLDYVSAFLGCLYAGVVAVPMFSPDLPGHEGRLAGVLEDCEPSVLMVTEAGAPGVAAFCQERGLPPSSLLVVDAIGTGQADSELPLPPRPAPGDVAYLQYTSGSTRNPAGVMITQANVVANARQGIGALDAEGERVTPIGWLPLYHDMGLLLSVASPIAGGFSSVLMDPVAFLEDPQRWLRLLGSYPGAITAAPNFAYDYCVMRTDEDTVEELDLSRVRVLLNGSEPVRTGTVDRFLAHFAPAGLAAEAMCPGYGLAEATVFVTSDSPHTEPAAVHCDPVALTDGRIELRPATDTGATALVLCGPPSDQEIRICHQETGEVLGEGAVGEIQLRGANVGLGYWKKSELTDRMFNVFAPGEDTSGQGWLRTGDLGALHEGQLLVTGRLKDLIIVDGRNHYPQDVEETVQSAVALVRRDRLTAVSAVRADGSGEELVVVAEHRRGHEPTAEQAAEALTTARSEISAKHGLRLADLVLVPPGEVPRTSSGKVARAASRTRLSQGGYDAVRVGR